ncbi:MAG: sulfite oxidase heme-binding subunit YedZ [Acidobacteriota bacterium]
MNRIWTHRWSKPIVFVVCLAPLAWLGWRWQNNALGINRIETVARYTGDWTLRFLVGVLCITPLRRLPGQSSLIRFRRMLGLFAFFYGCLHAWHYYAVDAEWNRDILWEDLTTRKFFVAGLFGLVVMVPLAATSWSGAIRWLGGRRWQRVHRLVYVAAIAGVVHYYWQGKAALWEPVYWGIGVGILLAYRTGRWIFEGIRRRKKKNT